MTAGRDRVVRPTRGSVLLLDDQPGCVDVGGVLVDPVLGTDCLDFYVVAVNAGDGCGFGVGDRVVLADPNAGRKVRLDGVVHRIVKADDIIAVME